MKQYLDLTPEERDDLNKQFLNDPEVFYEKAEMDQLRQALKRSWKERFLVMTSLMKMQWMLSKAKISENK